MSDVSARDLFLAVLCALVLARVVEMVLQATIFAVFRPHLEARQQRAAAAALAARLEAQHASAQRDAVSEMRSAIGDVRAIQEGAFLAGWRACEDCRQIATPEQEDHVMHHFEWRDGAQIVQRCARAGSGTCNALHPSGNICSRPPGHEPPHNHGALHWIDEQARAESDPPVDLRASLGPSVPLPPPPPSRRGR